MSSDTTTWCTWQCVIHSPISYYQCIVYSRANRLAMQALVCNLQKNIWLVYIICCCHWWLVWPFCSASLSLFVAVYLFTSIFLKIVLGMLSLRAQCTAKCRKPNLIQNIAVNIKTQPNTEYTTINTQRKLIPDTKEWCTQLEHACCCHDLNVRPQCQQVQFKVTKTTAFLFPIMFI